MAHALEVFFDPASEAVVNELWDRLEAAGLPSLATRTHRRHRPHVTLAVAQRIETARLLDVGRCLAVAHLDITLHSPAVFPRNGVLYLSVVPTRALLQLHEQVHAALDGSLVAPWGTYSVDAWVPHCTLAQELSAGQLARGRYSRSRSANSLTAGMERHVPSSPSSSAAHLRTVSVRCSSGTLTTSRQSRAASSGSGCLRITKEVARFSVALPQSSKNL